MIDDWYILGTDGHGFFKDTAGLRDGNGFICINHEVPWDINAEPSRVFLKKAVDFRAKKKNLW